MDLISLTYRCPESSAFGWSDLVSRTNTSKSVGIMQGDKHCSAPVQCRDVIKLAARVQLDHCIGPRHVLCWRGAMQQTSEACTAKGSLFMSI